MAIASYNDLAAAVKAWCARSDTTFSNQIETFVALHELTMYCGRGKQGDALYSEPLMAPETEAKTTIAFVAGVGSVPSDAAWVRTLTRDSDRIGIDYVTPRQYDILVAQNSGGPVRAFTVKGAQIHLNPSFDGSLNVLYYKKLAPVTLANQTNALITAYPLIYFHGCMFEAFAFLQNAQKAIEQFERYQTALAGVNGSIRGVRYGGAPLRVVQRNAIP